MASPGAYTRERIGVLVERALERAGVAGTIPTPLDAVRDALGIPEPAPIEALGPPSAGARLLGAFSFSERRMYLERRQPPGRRRFTEAHELVHALCPWHHAVLRLDTGAELFGPVRAAIEAEANAGAGLLLFQGRRFSRRLAEEAPSLRSALALAEAHAASAHATIRHYVEVHPRAAGLLVVGRFPLKGGGLPVWERVESPRFRERFGPLRERIGLELPHGSALHGLAEAARTSGLADATLRLDGVGAARAEAHYNRHTLLVLLAP
jgi:IrrE N-terminal-like domain